MRTPFLAPLFVSILAASPPARAEEAPIASAPAAEDASGKSFAGPSDEATVGMKVYGDTQFSANDGDGVSNSFQAAHLDLFFTAEVGRLTFLSELFIESGSENEFGIDGERLQLSYLFSNALRARVGRSHTAFGYYNDTYHHGNLFELTTWRPLSVQFEDEGGLMPAHLTGAGIDGTLEAGAAGAFHYDVEVGNGRLSDPNMVAFAQAGKNAKMANVRLRWLPPVEGLTLGVNGLYDVVPETPAAAGAATSTPRGEITQNSVGGHIVYIANGVHVLAEAMAVRNAVAGGANSTTKSGFVELGYTLGAWTPYVRPEYIKFPKDGDPYFQADAGSMWFGTSSLLDVRAGVRWLASPQVAMKFEYDRAKRDDSTINTGTVKVAFGF